MLLVVVCDEVSDARNVNFKCVLKILATTTFDDMQSKNNQKSHP
jgi:hypothetical protein